MQMPFYTSEVRSCRIEKKKERDTSRTFLRIRFNSLGLRSHVNRRQIKEAKKGEAVEKEGKNSKTKRSETRIARNIDFTGFDFWQTRYRASKRNSYVGCFWMFLGPIFFFLSAQGKE